MNIKSPSPLFRQAGYSKIFLVLLLVVVLIVIGYVLRIRQGRILQDKPPVGDGAQLEGFKVLTEQGGHLDFLPSTGQIAFDRLGDDGYYDLWLMATDGQKQNCLTCSIANLPRKHVGQPAWHPKGAYLVFQAQKDEAPKSTDNNAVPGAGALNDLWVIRLADSKVWKIREVSSEVSKNSQGLLHSHFSHDGRKLLWVERIGSGKSSFGAWELKLADFIIDAEGVPSLGNIRTLASKTEGAFYESHGFSPDDQKILYSSDAEGGLDIYSLELSSGKILKLTDSRNVWDEHAHYSPDGTKIVWMSSQGLRFSVRPFELETEFWIMNSDGSNKQRLTYVHDSKNQQYREGFAVAADNVWSKDGKSIYGLFITGRPETSQRGSGFIAEIDVSR